MRRAAFKDALYRDEKLKGDGELTLGKGIQGDCELGKPELEHICPPLTFASRAGASPAV